MKKEKDYIGDIASRPSRAAIAGARHLAVGGRHGRLSLPAEIAQAGRKALEYHVAPSNHQHGYPPRYRRTGGYLIIEP